jgi:N-acetylglutamate synthase-like GNAT family acetyltransferase
MVHIRPARADDLPDLVRLTNAEGWGYETDDLRRLLAVTPRGFLVAERSGVVGCLTVVCYPPTLGWVGNVVVQDTLRGTGAGRALMIEALRFCEETGLTSVYLDAFPPAVGFYLRLGFVEEAVTERWTRPAGMRAHTAGRIQEPERIRDADLERLAVADARVFGANRHSLFGHLLRDYPDWAWWCRDGNEPSAWLLSRPGARSAEIGPWCGREPEAEMLLDAVLPRFAKLSLELSVPEENEPARRVLSERGFRRSGSHVRMRRGAPVAWDRARTWALGGLEKG